MISKNRRFAIVFYCLMIVMLASGSHTYAQTKYVAPVVEILEEGYQLKLQVTTAATEYFVEWDTDKKFSHKNAYVLYDGREYGFQLVENKGQAINIHLPKIHDKYYIRAYAVYDTGAYQKKVSAVSNVVTVNLSEASKAVKPKGGYVTLRMQSKGGTVCKSLYLDLEEREKGYKLPVVERAGYNFVAWKIKSKGKTHILIKKNGGIITTKMLQNYVTLRDKKSYTIYASWKKVSTPKPVIKTRYVKGIDSLRVEIKLPRNATGYMLECADTKGFSYKKIHSLYRDNGKYLVRWSQKCDRRVQVIYIPTYEFGKNYTYIRCFCIGEEDSTNAKVLSDSSTIKKVSWKR